MIKFAKYLGLKEGGHSVAITGNVEACEDWLQSYNKGLARNNSA